MLDDGSPASGDPSTNERDKAVSKRTATEVQRNGRFIAPCSFDRHARFYKGVRRRNDKPETDVPGALLP